MSDLERRIDSRVDLNVPIRFRPITHPASEEQQGESANVSQRGVYMATSFPLTVGTQIELELRIPQELQGTATREVRCMARVIHIQADTFLDGRAGVGLQLER
jgi:hypothetical protein